MRTNKDRLCEERTTILSGCWTSPVCLYTILYKEISFFESDYCENKLKYEGVREDS